ncbi:cis-prenyltransferase [Rhodotorula toruloides]
MLPELAAWLPGWRSAPEMKAPTDPAASDVHLPFSSFLTWIPQSVHPFLRSLLIASLRLGPRPQHVAFIMDGNRRSARERKLPVRVGHEEGFEALKRVLSFLLKLEIPHVTVYAFSIENFNRDPMEVEALMDMARKRLVEICQHGALLDQHGIQIRVLGRRDLLPPDVQESCAEAEALTAGNTKGILNLCCPYGSQEEIATAIKRTVESCHEGKLSPSNITEEHIAANLYTAASPPLDILIRTSGVSRLSDFLLWQSNESTILHFITPNWPDIGVADILPPLLSYQAEVWVGQVSDTLESWRRWSVGERTSRRVKADALEAWLVLNFVRLPTGAAHAAARAHGLARIDMEESYELALDIAWNATKFQEDEYDRVARLKYRMMRVMDDYLDHSQGHKKRRGPAHTRPKMQHTPKLYSFPTLSAEFTFMRVRLNEAWKVDRQNAPQRLERLRKMVLQNQELAKRYQEAAGMAGREEAPASAVNGGVDVVNLTPETAVVCSDWRLALEEDDNEYFAAPPVFDS